MMFMHVGAHIYSDEYCFRPIIVRLYLFLKLETAWNFTSQSQAQSTPTCQRF